MKKLVLLLLIVSLVLSCRPRKEGGDRFFEDGVEVVINRIEPCEIKGAPTNCVLEEIFRIDSEKEELAEIGLTDVWRFDVDSEGNIYLMGYNTREDAFFKFDQNGSFVTSFGPRGQGPGEVLRPAGIRISSGDEIFVLDTGNSKLVIYGKTGELIREQSVDPGVVEMVPLDVEKYLIKQRSIPEGPTGEFIALDSLLICGPGFMEERKLEVERIPNIASITQFRPMFSVFYSFSDANIYVGNSEKGYEILSYNPDGDVLRKLRKQYVPAKVPEAYKRKLEGLFERMGREISFPEFLPPFQYLFCDDRGWLFVMTFEEGSKAREYVYDVFNPDGVFVARMLLDNFGFLEYFGGEGPLDAKAQAGRLYSIREKESGYKELVVSRAGWE